MDYSHGIEVAKDVLIQEIDGESALLDLKSGRYFGLDEVGTRMWSLLSGEETVQAAYERLLEEYEVDASTLKEELDALLGKLLDRGLIEVVHG